MLTNHRYGLGGGYVVAWIPVVHFRNAIEVLLKDLFSTRETVTSAHRKIMADRATS